MRVELSECNCKQSLAIIFQLTIYTFFNFEIKLFETMQVSRLVYARLQIEVGIRVVNTQSPWILWPAVGHEEKTNRWPTAVSRVKNRPQCHAMSNSTPIFKSGVI